MSRSKRNAAAEDYLRRAPNWSTAAMADLAALLPHCRQNEQTILASIVLAVESGHKFVLPDYGEILGAEVTPSIVETARDSRLPFGSVVLEFCAPARGTLEEGRVAVERRLVVCTEILDAPERAFSGGFMAWPIPYVGGRWIPPTFGVGFYYTQHRTDDQALAIAPFGEHGERVTRELVEEGRSVEDFVFREYVTEIRTVCQFLAALSCTNVTAEILRPNREARAARPGSTLFDYHILMVDPSKERNPSEDRGGTHASPRTHLRRGHIRRLAWGPRVWVNSCVVNPTALGTVDKDYRLKGGQK